MKVLIVEEKYNNKKLIDYLQKKFDGLSSTTIYKALRKKDIRINDKRVSENCLLQTGDEIKVYITDNLLFKTTDIPMFMKMKILLYLISHQTWKQLEIAL